MRGTMRSPMHALGSFAWHSRTIQKLSPSGSQMFEEMNADTCTRHICSHRHHHPMHLSAHGEAQIVGDGSECSPNTLDLLSFLVHLLLVLSGTMYEACCKDALGTVFSISTSDLCCCFFAGEFSALFTCALGLLGSVVVGQCSGLRHDCLIRMQRAETRRSWEERASAHQWEQHASAPDSSSDEADIEDCTRDDAGEALGELLVHLHIQRVLSAKQFSIICWWAAKAGAVGPVNAYALGPNSQTGAYQRHVDRCLGLDKSADDSYVIQAPGNDKFNVSRSSHDIPVTLTQEALHDELTGTPQVLDELQSLVDRDALPPTYTTHPVVAAAHWAAVVPLAFFCDGAPFTKRDGFLAFWMQNLISGSRTLACVLRKSSLCHCGCRGYCTLFPVLNVLRW